jgi:hypothetical protein
MTNPWQEYKKKLGDARPWDFLNPKTEYEDEDVSKARLEICESCPRLIKTTKQCRECGCFMALKVKLKNATCPINKW